MNAACWNCHVPLEDNTEVSELTGSEFCRSCLACVKEGTRLKDGADNGSHIEAKEASGIR